MKENKLNSAWEKVVLSRHKDRPSSIYYINEITDSFLELHGDKVSGDDKAVIAGIGKMNNMAVCLIGITRGETINENIERNFGMASPEGYRKSLRVMKLAERQRMPIICFIDTPGAYCGAEAEINGQGFAIAGNLMEMSHLRVPIISVFIGQGGSGGALALGISDRVLMLENSIYSILSPEGFASILWRDPERVKEAASKMKLTAKDLLEFKVIDRIIDEPTGGAHNNREEMGNRLKEVIFNELNELMKYDIDYILANRFNKYRFNLY